MSGKVFGPEVYTMFLHGLFGEMLLGRRSQVIKNDVTLTIKNVPTEPIAGQAWRVGLGLYLKLLLCSIQNGSHSPYNIFLHIRIYIYIYIEIMVRAYIHALFCLYPVLSTRHTTFWKFP